MGWDWFGWKFKECYKAFIVFEILAEYLDSNIKYPKSEYIREIQINKAGYCGKGCKRLSYSYVWTGVN